MAHPTPSIVSTLNPFNSSSMETPPLRILMVEDDPVMQLGLEQFFGDLSDVTIIGQATDGYSAIDLALRLQPDVVLMDIGLPKLDGIAATQEIKAQMPDLRIIMLTSHTADTEMIAALSAGADAYCVKGTSLDQFKIAFAAVQQGATYLDPQIARRIIDQFKPVVSHTGISQLSERELQVLKLIVEGKSNPEIAATLYLSLSTVKTYVRGILNKLAVDDRVQAAVVALRSGLV